MATHMPVTENTVIAIKIQVHATTKKLKLPLKDLGADHLIPKVFCFAFNWQLPTHGSDIVLTLNPSSVVCS